MLRKIPAELDMRWPQREFLSALEKKLELNRQIINEGNCIGEKLELVKIYKISGKYLGIKELKNV